MGQPIEIMFSGNLWDVLSDRLRTEECPRSVDIQCSFPLVRSHLHRMLAAHHTREAYQDIYTPKLLSASIHCHLDLRRISHIDPLSQYRCMREIRSQSVDLCACVRRIEIEEGKTRKAVFEQCPRIDQGKTSSAASH